jgi:hypothetical protein
MDRYGRVQVAMALVHQAMEGAGAWTDSEQAWDEVYGTVRSNPSCIESDIARALDECRLMHWEADLWDGIGPDDQREILTIAGRLYWEGIMALARELVH